MISNHVRNIPRLQPICSASPVSRRGARVVLGRGNLSPRCLPDSAGRPSARCRARIAPNQTFGIGEVLGGSHSAVQYAVLHENRRDSKPLRGTKETAASHRAAIGAKDNIDVAIAKQCRQTDRDIAHSLRRDFDKLAQQPTQRTVDTGQPR